LFGQQSFSRIGSPIEKAPIDMPLKEIAVHAGQEVLMEVDDNILLIDKGF
jgi:hypothetical protein